MIFDPERYYIRRPGALGIFNPSEEGTPGIYEPARVRINDYGLRGRVDTEADTLRIAAIGGSTVEDNMLNDGEMWTGQLEYQLGRGVWVANMGRSSTNAYHHAIQLEKVLPYLPSLDIVLVLCGLNDMLNDCGAHQPQDMGEDGCFGHIPGGHVDSWSVSEPGHNLGDAILGFKIRRRRVHDQDWIGPQHNPEKLVEYRERLEDIAGIIDWHGAAAVFLTQPAIWHPEMSDDELDHLYAGGLGDTTQWNRDPDNKWYTPAALLTMLDEYNAVMRAFCSKRDLRCIDLAAHLRPEVVNYYDDFHFSRLGAARVAGIVARGLRDLGLAPEAARPKRAAAGGIYSIW